MREAPPALWARQQASGQGCGAQPPPGSNAAPTPVLDLPKTVPTCFCHHYLPAPADRPCTTCRLPREPRLARPLRKELTGLRRGRAGAAGRGRPASSCAVLRGKKKKAVLGIKQNVVSTRACTGVCQIPEIALGGLGE